MMNTNNYVEKSLELHMFFGRIMKEHSFFLEAGFTPANKEFSEKAEHFKNEFDKLLCEAVMLGNGFVNQQLLCSQELVTEFTALAEKQTECLTGIPINKEITGKELHLKSGCGRCTDNSERRGKVRQLNQTALKLLDGLISFKETILKKVLCGEMFTANYPLLIEHIIREAKLYREYVECLEKNGFLDNRSMKDVECFWNRIMMEHAMFIRGLLDPSETELFDSADKFADEYRELLNRCRNAQNYASESDSLELTKKLKDFKMAGVRGIEQCEIRSIILPLLADHVLREANHYIRLLKN
ncbi:MAG: DUF2935 domain-containing protein [Oscillospiraceae bacterium]|nr:DUF2935 domain-containing protein [Oscillospiraceae bacterium]